VAWGLVEGILITWPGLLQEPLRGYGRWLARALFVAFLALLVADKSYEDDRKPG
jgi:hypothetical protein